MNETQILNLAFKLGYKWIEWTDFANSTPDERWNDLDVRDKREDFKNEIDDLVKEIGQGIREYKLPLTTYHDIQTGEIVAWKKDRPEDHLLKIRQAFEVFTAAMVNQDDVIYFDKKVQRDAFEALEKAIKP